MSAVNLEVESEKLLPAYPDDTDRRLANHAFYTRLDVTDDEQLRPTLAEPFATIFREAHDSGDEGKEAKREHSTSSDVACSRKALLVEPGGLEPPTPCLQSRCATNCAMAPCVRPQATGSVTSVQTARS